jgi:glycerophosphoryl diester phosphodiesterase
MKIIGHRGARGLAPENTIAALRKGLEHHADMLEFDLRVTKDGVVILHHDADLTDPNGTKRSVDSHTYEELKTHKKDLATFEEVLETIGRAVPLYIEVKREVRVGPIIKQLETN